MFGLKAYHAICATKITYDNPGEASRFMIAVLTALKPNLMRYDSWNVQSPATTPPNFTPELTFACDGKAEFRQYGSHYRTETKTDPASLHTILEPWDGFYTKSRSLAALYEEAARSDAKANVSDIGTSDVNGVQCNKIAVHHTDSFSGTNMETYSVYYIGEADHLVRRATSHVSFDGKQGHTFDAVLQDIDTHPVIDPTVFKYKPPVGVVKEIDEKSPSPIISHRVAAPGAFESLRAQSILGQGS